MVDDAKKPVVELAEIMFRNALKIKKESEAKKL